MAAEVSADLTLINDEDVLRRMWADTEDFGRKKEIRARMYKLREQRLKDFYTTGDVVTEVTGRKHLAKTHADSISDQGFITMKTKEIRDSESPTRDFSQRAEQGNGYWNSRQEHTYATGNDDGAIVEMKSNVTEGQGLIKEGNTGTQMAMAAHNLHESSSKTDDNMSAKSEHQSHASKMVSSSKTDSGDNTTTMVKSAKEQSSEMKSEQKSSTSSTSTTKWSSSSSSSRRVVSSSSQQNYQVTSGQEFQSLRDVDDRDTRELASLDDTTSVNRRIVGSNKEFSKINDTNISEDNCSTRVTNDSNTSRTSSRNVQSDSQEFTYHSTQENVDVKNDQHLRTNEVNIQNSQTTNEKRLAEQNERLYELRDSREGKNVNETYSQNVIREVQDHEKDIVDRYNQSTDSRKYITNERIDTQDSRRKENKYINDNIEDTRETRVQRNEVDDTRHTSRVQRTSRTDCEVNSTVTDQKIMNEIHKLDTYLSSQNTPAHSTPVSPHRVTDGDNWTVVSSKDGEFTYHEEKPVSTQPAPSQPSSKSVPKQPTPSSTPVSSQTPQTQPVTSYPAPPTSPSHSSAHIPNQETLSYSSPNDFVPTYHTPTDTSPKEPSHSVQPREKIVKHPSSLDLPKEATDGQYVTTYQQSYNRISVDNSPSHDFFASTLRASPDRSTPSPTKRIPSRSSLDRSSPERRMRATSKGSLDRSSPETKPRSTSKSSLDRSSPERKYRPSSNKTPDRERRVSAGSFTIEKSKDTRRKSSDTSKTNSVKETATKTKRKFSSTQAKAVNKTRVSTPGASPSTSPTRKNRPKDTTTTTDSDSDVSHSTYKKSTCVTSQDRNVSVRHENTTVVTKQNAVVTDQKNILHKEPSVPRDKSPEYSSEGSVSREIRENRVRDQPHEFSPDRSAFAPIKQIRTNVEEKGQTINLITTERQIINDEMDARVGVREEEVRPISKEPTNKSQESDKPKNSMPQRTSSTDKIVTEVDSCVSIKKVNKETEITNVESVRRSPYSSSERLKEKSQSPVRRDDEVMKDRPVTRTPSSSPSPERTTRRPQPSKTEKTTTSQKETKTFISEEKHRTIPEKVADTIRKTVETRRTSKEITEHTPKKKPRESSPSSKPEPSLQKFRPESPRKQPSSPAESPERRSPGRRPSATSPQRSLVSPDRPSLRRRPQQPSPQKYKPSDSPRNVVRQIETDTQKTTRRTVISETNKLPRKSSIPRADTKPVSRVQTSKERPETINRTPVNARKPQNNSYTSPQKTRTPLSERTIVTVTKTTKVTERKPLGKSKESPVQLSNGNIKKIPTSSPKKPAILATTPYTSPTTRKENIPQQRRPKETGSVPSKDVRHPSNQKENKKPIRPVSESVLNKKTTTHAKDIRTVTNRKSQEIVEFLQHEKPKDVSDLEDECPPEEFYVDFDDNSQTTDDTRQSTTRINKVEIVKSSAKEITPNYPLKQSQKKPTTKPKQNLKEPKSVNYMTKTPSDDVQRKVPVKGEDLLSSDEEEEITEVREQLIIDEHYSTTNREEKRESVIKNSNQDLLTVIVQHPKSSRESSPGYPATGVPFCSTSEDGESNPRYADFISEPDTDADTYDKVKPVPFRDQTTVQVTDLDDEETEVRTSVAERVNEFLEAAKQTREQEISKPEVQIDSAKSVLKAKALFENIAKNQTTVNVTSTKSINIYETQPEPFIKPTVASPKQSKSVRETEPTRKPEERLSYPSKQINELPKSARTTDLVPSDDETVPTYQPVKPKSAPKNYNTVDRQEKINYDEEKYEEQQIKEITTKITKSDVPPEPVETSKVTKNAREQPEKKEPKKSLDRKPSGPTANISSKKDFFERKAQNVDKPKSPVKDTGRAKPQKAIPKGGKNRPEPDELYDQLTAKGHVSDKVERTESYLRSTVASSVRSHTPEKQPKDRRDSKPEVLDKTPEEHEQSPIRQGQTEAERTDSYLRSTVASTVRSQTPDKLPKGRRDSKPDVLDKAPFKSKEHERSPTRPVDLLRKTSKPEEPTGKTSRLDEVTRKTSKPEDYPHRPSKEEFPTNRQTKPKERSKSPLKPDERMKSPSKVIEATRGVQKTVELTKRPSKTETSPSRQIKPESEEIKPSIKDRDVNTLFKHSEQTVEVHKEGKFGVTLRKTPSSTKVTTVTTKTTSKKPTTHGDLPEIEDIFDLEVLEDLLLKAVGYDERRRIRAQIRIVKKQLEEEYNTPGKSRTVTTTTTTTYTTTIPSVKDIKAQSPKFSKPDESTTLYARSTKTTSDNVTKRHEVHKSPERRTERVTPERQVTKSPERNFTRSPERKSPDRRVESRKTETRTETVRTVRKESSPKRELPDRKVDRNSPEKQTPKSTDRKSPDRKLVGKLEPKAKQPAEKPTERKFSADRKKSETDENVLDRRNRIELTSRDSKSDINYETTTTVKSQTFRQVTSTSDSKETCPTDSITSSYGVGPTDENGRPLFGLKALRRTNTNKTLGENELEEQITVIEDENEEVYDSNGRPLFGLKALQATTEEDTMPAQTAQLRELVEKHQQYARESSAKEIKPVQKPKAKLRDSFILTAEDDLATTTTTTATSQPDEATRGLSLRSIIKKHEQISNSGGRIESEVESRSTVVTSHSTLSSDGKITHKKNIIHGEISSKNGETPVGKITQKTYTYQTPDDKQSLPTIKSTTKTSSIGQRRSSGPKIEEVKDESSLNIDLARRYSKEYTVEEGDSIINQNKNEVLRKSSDVSEGNTTTKSYTSILKSTNKDEEWNTTGGTTTVTRRTSGPKLTEFPEEGIKSKVTTTTTTTTTRTVIPDSKEDGKRPLGRGDSVKALQHKFQQATVSSTLKQSNVERTDSKGRIHETKSREIITTSPVISTQVKTLEDSQTVKTSPTTVTTKITTVTKGPVQEMKTTKVTETVTKSGATSFLDDNTKVTGVQDILTRMRNADLVSESGDTSEDAEARALLNKFLGASVILQGMEQGMKAVQSTPEAPSSAALVIQAEKQRVKDANIRTQEYDIDDISDEKQLRILLEACSDYEGRRKIRARLRTIMADHKGADEISEYHTGLVSNNSLDSTDSSQMVIKEDGDTKTEVRTRTSTSTARLTKANSVQSPFAKFRQMERQNSAPSVGRGAPNYVTEPKVVTSVSYIKEHLLNWVQAQTRGYKNIQIENFSTSWSDGLAFCALIHHFCPNAFDYDSLTPQNRRYNFELAFRVAEEEDIYPLLDVEDMVSMRKPDWKCVFTYVQSVYRRFQNSPDALPANPYV
ncbi:uncharacterized protein isoform X3 [Rhodnius prolixus]|uniref:uncharacterized protein isoform X3 n=1 Tax=Rhodnius prolixus TaxID=13249 RepID=UPI003D18919F